MLCASQVCQLSASVIPFVPSRNNGIWKVPGRLEVLPVGAGETDCSFTDNAQVNTRLNYRNGPNLACFKVERWRQDSPKNSSAIRVFRRERRSSTLFARGNIDIPATSKIEPIGCNLKDGRPVPIFDHVILWRKYESSLTTRFDALPYLSIAIFLISAPEFCQFTTVSMLPYHFRNPLLCCMETTSRPA